MATGTFPTNNWKLLWTNPNPANNFPAQTVLVNLAGYTFARIVFSDSGASDMSNKRFYAQDIKVGRNGQLLMLYLPSDATSCHAYTKDVTVSASSVDFSDTKDKALSTATAAVTSNQAVIPQFIYAQ